jgi:hypothetical protein
MARRRYLYTQQGQPIPGGPIEITEDWREPPSTSVGIMSGRFYENTGTIDGVDIGSRTKRNNYMRQNGLTDTSDYRGEWKQAEKTRETIRTGEYDRKARRETLARALYTHPKMKP